MKYLVLLACVSVTLAIAAPAPAQDKEAEKLFRDMEKKILAAKAFDATCSYQAGKRKAKAELLATSDNKVRLKVAGHFAGKRGGFELVSDGKQTKVKGARVYVMPSGLPVIEAGEDSEWPTPKGFHAALGATLSRGGMWFTLMVLPYIREGDRGALDPDKARMKVYDFKLDAAEKVGDREAKVVRYRFGEGDGGRDDEEITLWIDAKTLLPLKRSFVLKIERLPISETYERFMIDPKIDARAFELPK